MTRHFLTVTLAGLVGLAVAVPGVGAQTPDDRCKAVIEKRNPEVLKDPNNTSGFCNLLAGQLYVELTKGTIDKVFTTGTTQVGDIFSQRDLQNRATQHAAPGGTAAQGEALPSVQPAGVAAGTIAALGTRAGQDAIAALSLNPGVLFLADTARRGLAQASRLADVTVYVPISGVTPTASAVTPAPGAPAPATGSANNELRYVGVRVRLNFLGLGAGDAIWEKAEAMLKEQIIEGVGFQSHLAQVLAKVDDVQKCVDALTPGSPAPAEGAAAPCDTLDVKWTLSEETATRLHDQLRIIRRRADARYLGADIRYDFGDPTLGEVKDARGKYLFAGLAGGFRADDGVQRTSVGVRGRLGIRHAHLDAITDSEQSVEGGLGIEVARRLDDDAELNVSGAIEFRKGGTPETIPDAANVFQTEFVMLRGSIVLPVTKANSISINVGKPIWGDVSPIFSVNFNWGLLLSDRPGR